MGENAFGVNVKKNVYLSPLPSKIHKVLRSLNLSGHFSSERQHSWVRCVLWRQTPNNAIRPLHTMVAMDTSTALKPIPDDSYAQI